jgi:hypothetical protein
MVRRQRRERPRLRFGLFAAAAALVAAIALTSIGAAGSFARGFRSSVDLGSGEPGVALDGGELLIALPFLNRGTRSASDVRLEAVSLRAHDLLAPETLPLALGDLDGGEKRVLQLAFSPTGPSARGPYRLILRGTHRVEGRWGTTRRSFVVRRSIPKPLPDEGVSRTRRAVVSPRTVEGANFPPAAVESRIGEEPDALPLPERRDVGIPEPRNPSVGLFEVPSVLSAGPGTIAGAVGDEVLFVRAGAEPLTFEDTKGGIPWDPSGGSIDLNPRHRIVFLTGNLYALLSTDGGATFTHLDPTTVFGYIPLDGMPPDEGFCCDMNLLYVPSIDRFVWVLLTHGFPIDFKPDKDGNPVAIRGYNRLRVASASPAQVLASGGTAWTYWDMTTALFGFPKEAFLDYPDVSFTDSFLHVSVVRPDMDGFFVIRVPLADVQSGGTINISYTNPVHGKSAVGARLAHDTEDGAYWFGHVATTKVRIFEWLDGSNGYSWRSLNVDPWCNESSTQPWCNQGNASIAPNGVNWIEANSSAIRGATYQGKATLGGGVARFFLVAWNGARGGGFPQPHVRLLPITKLEVGGSTTWGAGTESQIWNPDFAFHHAHLATNANGEVGVSLGAGGGGSHASPVAGFAFDSTLYVTGVSTESIARYGDYTAIRPHRPNTKLFLVTDYFLVGSAAGGFTVNHQYRLFGRSGDQGNTF